MYILLTRLISYEASRGHCVSYVLLCYNRPPSYTPTAFLFMDNNGIVITTLAYTAPALLRLTLSTGVYSLLPNYIHERIYECKKMQFRRI